MCTYVYGCVYKRPMEQQRLRDFYIVCLGIWSTLFAYYIIYSIFIYTARELSSNCLNQTSILWVAFIAPPSSRLPLPKVSNHNNFVLIDISLSQQLYTIKLHGKCEWDTRAVSVNHSYGPPVVLRFGTADIIIK